MNEEEINTQTRTHNPPANIVMGIIIFLAVTGVAVGVLSIVRNVKSPFDSDPNLAAVASVDMTDQMQTAQRMEKLKIQDSDSDGLSDFDELYTHKTSPYLKDTDSDGYDDKTEIATGHDANCPDGQNCFRQDLAEKKDDGTNSVVPSVLKDNLNTSPIDQALATGTEPTPEQLRALLKQQGLTDEEIQRFYDKTLLETYKETLANTRLPQTITPSGAAQPSTVTPIAPVAQTDPGSATAPDYSQYTPDQIRALVRSTGKITEAQLSLIDDATLKDLFSKSVSATTKQ